MVLKHRQRWHAGQIWVLLYILQYMQVEALVRKRESGIIWPLSEQYMYRCTAVPAALSLPTAADVTTAPAALSAASFARCSIERPARSAAGASATSAVGWLSSAAAAAADPMGVPAAASLARCSIERVEGTAGKTGATGLGDELSPRGTPLAAAAAEVDAPTRAVAGTLLGALPTPGAVSVAPAATATFGVALRACFRDESRQCGRAAFCIRRPIPYHMNQLCFQWKDDTTQDLQEILPLWPNTRYPIQKKG